MEGVLVLNGGEEFQPGNEPQDELLVEAAGNGPAFILPTAAARQGPDRAIANAIRWFSRLGLEARALRVLGRADANDERLAFEAAQGSFFYLVGGDPGHVVKTLEGTRVWAAMAAAWRSGAALGGSSAGAMALAAWTLVMARWPHHETRRAVPALDLVPGTAVIPHYERFGQRWQRGPIQDAPEELVRLGLDEKTAAVWDGQRWTAAGAGSVRVGDRTFARGEPVVGIPEPRR